MSRTRLSALGLPAHRTNSAGMRKQGIAAGAQDRLADAWGRIAFNYYNWRQVGSGHMELFRF